MIFNVSLMHPLTSREQVLYLTPFFFCGAARALWPNAERSGTRLARRLERVRRRLVFDELADPACADAGVEQLQYFEASGYFVFEHDDGVVDFDFASGFARLTADCDAAKTAGVGGEGAGFEYAHRPEPLVQPHG